MMDRRLSASARHWTALACIVLVAILLRAGWAALSDARPVLDDDTATYGALGDSLARGDGYRNAFGVTTAYLPPAYPAALAASFKLGGHRLLVAKALNVVLGAATVLATYALARAMATHAAALIAAGMVALLPGQVISTPLLVPDHALLPLLLAGLAAYARAHSATRPIVWALLAGALLGAAALARPQAALLCVALAVHAVVLAGGTRRALRLALPLVAASALVVSPWVARNAVEMDTIALSTNAGVAFWIGHHDGASGNREFPGVLIERLDRDDSPEEAERRLDRDGWRLGWSYVAHHRVEDAANLPKKLFWLFGDDEAWMDLNEGFGARPWLTPQARDLYFTASNVFYYALLASAALGIALTWKRWCAGASGVLVFASYWVAVHLAFYGDPRFHLALLPALAPFAAVAALAVARAERGRDIASAKSGGDSDSR